MKIVSLNFNMHAPNFKSLRSKTNTIINLVSWTTKTGILKSWIWKAKSKFRRRKKTENLYSFVQKFGLQFIQATVGKINIDVYKVYTDFDEMSQIRWDRWRARRRFEDATILWGY